MSANAASSSGNRSRDTDTTRDSNRLNESKTLTQHIKATRKEERAQRRQPGEGPSSEQYFTPEQRAYHASKGKIQNAVAQSPKLNAAAKATLKRLTYDATLEGLQARFGIHSREARSFQWSHRNNMPQCDYDSDTDSHRNLSVQQQDEFLARQIEYDQEQHHPHPPVQEVESFSEQDRADDAEARRELAKTAEDSSYAAALQRSPTKQHHTRAAAAQTQVGQAPATSEQESDRTDPPPSRRRTATPQAQDNIAKMRATIQNAEQNVLNMQAQKRKTVEIPPQVTRRPPPQMPVLNDNEEQLDWGDESDPEPEVPPAPPAPVQPASNAQPVQHAPAQQAAAQQLPAQHVASRIVAQNRFAPIAPEAQNRPTAARHAPPQHPAFQPHPVRRAAQHVVQPAAHNSRMHPAAQPIQAAATTASLNADTYFNLPFGDLEWNQKEQIRKTLPSAVFQNFDEFAKNQSNSAVMWINGLELKLRDFSVNPDHAVRYLNHEHLGNNTTRVMAQWMMMNPTATFTEFKTAFVSLNPGKPPLVTRQTWKALHMKNSGTYHAYLQEFTRQMNLISTGPDEVIEQFLHGLSLSSDNKLSFSRIEIGLLMNSKSLCMQLLNE